MSSNCKWVVIGKLVELTGYSEDAIRSKISKGVLRETVHFRRAPDNRILFNLEAFWKWVEGTLE